MSRLLGVLENILLRARRAWNCWVMYGNWPDLFLQALEDTLEMTTTAGLIAFVAGLSLRLVLVASTRAVSGSTAG